MIRLALLRFLETYFRRRWLYTLPLLLMIAVGILYTLTTPPSYVAGGTLYIQKESLLSSLNALNNEGFAWVTPAEATTGELGELLSSTAFMRAIVQNTDLEEEMDNGQEVVNQTLQSARSAIWVQTLGNNLVLIGASYSEADIAQQLVSSTIETFVQWKINVSRNESVEAQAFFIDLIRDYRAELEPARQELTEYLSARPDPVRGERPAAEKAEIARLEAAVAQAEQRLRAAQDKEENARLVLAQTESDVRQTYFVVDAPSLPDEPIRSKKDMAVSIAVFVILGSFLSLAATVGGTVLDRGFRFPIDVQQNLHLPVLAMIPESRERAASAADARGLPTSVEQLANESHLPSQRKVAANDSPVPNGAHANGVQQNGVQQNGVQQNGVQQNGVHSNGAPIPKRINRRQRLFGQK